MSALSPTVILPNVKPGNENGPHLVFGAASTTSLQIASRNQHPARIAMIGNHLPRQCGIATFTTDLCDAIVAEYGKDGVSVVAVNDSPAGYKYPARVCQEINQDDPCSYHAAADSLNSSNVDIVSLQHEYGIFGGGAGGYILQLLQRLTMPVVTTLHTVLRQPDATQQIVMREIVERSERLIVMSEHSSHLLQQVFGVSPEKIDVIPHGIPDMPFAAPDAYKQLFSINGRTVMLTFGLLSPNKGLETVIRALPEILSQHSNVVYVIAGATHPHVRLREGDRYRMQLQKLTRDQGVEQAVIFFNRFFSPREMAALVGSADIYVTPYCQEAQAVSGTLAYALGAGKAIISTPYWHAAELLGNGRGALVPFDDSGAIAATAIELLENSAARQAMCARAYCYGRSMVWNRVAQSYMQSFGQAITARVAPVRMGFPVRPSKEIMARRMASA